MPCNACPPLSTRILDTCLCSDRTIRYQYFLGSSNSSLSDWIDECPYGLYDSSLRNQADKCLSLLIWFQSERSDWWTSHYWRSHPNLLHLQKGSSDLALIPVMGCRSEYTTLIIMWYACDPTDRLTWSSLICTLSAEIILDCFYKFNHTFSYLTLMQTWSSLCINYWTQGNVDNKHCTYVVYISCMLCDTHCMQIRLLLVRKVWGKFRLMLNNT